MPFWAHAMRTPGGAVASQLGDGVERPLRLHGQDHDVAGGRAGLGGMADDRHGQGHRAAGGHEGEAPVAQHVEVGTPGDEGDVGPRLEQPAADGPADGPGSVDHVAHRASLAVVIRRAPHRRRREFSVGRVESGDRRSSPWYTSVLRRTPTCSTWHC